MTELYPLFGKPVLKDYIWGGRNLTDLGRVLPAGKKVAESWEIAAHPDGMSTVENGIYTGQTLQALTEQFGEGLVGTRGEWALSRGRFPLLVKLLDANQSLSVQVHPDDDYAQMYAGGDLGKAEMWVVLRAEPNAAIIYGLYKKRNTGTASASDSDGQVGEVSQPFANQGWGPCLHPRRDSACAFGRCSSGGDSAKLQHDLPCL